MMIYPHVLSQIIQTYNTGTQHICVQKNQFFVISFNITMNLLTFFT